LRKAETGNVTPAKPVLSRVEGAGVYGEKTGFLLPAFAGTSFAGMTNALSATGTNYEAGEMPKQIKITAGQVQVEAELNDCPTAKAIADALAIRAKAQRWGGEIYFSIPVTAELEEDARQVLQPGDLGYWPTGNAFCIFFGATPASQGDEIRAASAVNIIGRIKGDLSQLWGVPDGADVSIEIL